MTNDATDDLVLDAARAVRPYLARLVAAEDVSQVDGALQAALERGRTENVDDELERLFASRPLLEDWVSAYLEHGVPLEFVEHVERAARPPGDPAVLPLPARFVCPVDGDYVRFARLAFEPPGMCPDHLVQLVSAGGG
jgi:hypothetical protein